MGSRPPSPQSDSDSSVVEDQPLRLVEPAILSVLSHLDLSEHISFEETKIISSGTFGDISRSRCTLPQHGKVRVAIKRLRFYAADDIKTVRDF